MSTFTLPASDNTSVPILKIGSVYFNDRNTNPSEYFGGIWGKISKGKFIVGVDEDDDDFASYGLTGGEKEVTLTPSEMPNHGHIWKPRSERMYFATGSATTLSFIYLASNSVNRRVRECNLSLFCFRTNNEQRNLLYCLP